MAEPIHRLHRPGRWQIFASWHRDPAFYRDAYTRAISALVAAFVIYVVAVLGGLVSARPLFWLMMVIGVTSLGAGGVSTIQAIKLSRSVGAFRLRTEAFSVSPEYLPDHPDRDRNLFRLMNRVLALLFVGGAFVVAGTIALEHM